MRLDVYTDASWCETTGSGAVAGFATLDGIPVEEFSQLTEEAYRGSLSKSTDAEVVALACGARVASRLGQRFGIWILAQRLSPEKIAERMKRGNDDPYIVRQIRAAHRIASRLTSPLVLSVRVLNDCNAAVDALTGVPCGDVQEWAAARCRAAAETLERIGCSLVLGRVPRRSNRAADQVARRLMRRRARPVPILVWRNGAA